MAIICQLRRNDVRHSGLSVRSRPRPGITGDARPYTHGDERFAHLYGESFTSREGLRDYRRRAMIWRLDYPRCTRGDQTRIFPDLAHNQSQSYHPDDEDFFPGEGFSSPERANL